MKRVMLVLQSTPNTILLSVVRGSLMMYPEVALQFVNSDLLVKQPAQKCFSLVYAPA